MYEYMCLNFVHLLYVIVTNVINIDLCFLSDVSNGLLSQLAQG